MTTPNASNPQKKTSAAMIFAAIIAALFFLGLLGLLYYGVQRSGDDNRDALPSALIGKPAPAFDLPILHAPDKRLSLEQLKGRAFVMNVWGSWCPECRVEHSVIARLAYSKRVAVIGYNLKDERADALAWLEKYDNPYAAVITDLDGRAALDWGIYGAPETFLVDAKGIVRWKYVGPLSDKVVDEQLLPLLDKLDAGQ